MIDHSVVLARIAARAAEDEPMSPLISRPAPLSAEELASVERRLGFALHPLLAAAYRGFANGGFGPEYQLLSLVDGPTSEQAVDVYLTRRSDGAGTEWAWPEGVLPILPWGCGMYACVDCRSEHGTVLLFDPNPGDPDLAWYVDAPSLEAWFDGYVNRTGWWDKLEDGDEPYLPPWPDRKARTSVAVCHSAGMGYSGYFVLAQTERPLLQLPSLTALELDCNDMTQAGGWRLGQFHPGAGEGPAPRRLARELVDDTGRPALAMYVVDSDFADVGGHSPDGDPFWFILNPELVEEFDEVPTPPLVEETVAALVAWATEAGLTASPQLLADAITQSPGPFGEGVDALIRALGIGEV